MPLPVKSTVVDSWPLPTAKDDKTDRVEAAVRQQRRRVVLNSRPALDEKTVDRQDTSDSSDNHDLAGEKVLEVQAGTQDSRPKPPQPMTIAAEVANPSLLPAAPTTTVASATHGGAGNKSKKKKNDKYKDKDGNKNKTKHDKTEKQDVKAGDADHQSNTCLLFHHHGDRHGDRHGSRKGGKSGHIGVFQKVRTWVGPYENFGFLSLVILHAMRNPWMCNEMAPIRNNSGKGFPSFLSILLQYPEYPEYLDCQILLASGCWQCWQSALAVLQVVQGG